MTWSWMMDIPETHEYYLEKYGLGIHSLMDGGEIHISDYKIVFRSNGNIHRDNGPARIWCDGDQAWYIDGELHRIDGPAVMNIYDNDEQEWMINGYNVDWEIRQWANDNNVDLDNLTEQDKILIKLVWSDYHE